MGHPPKRKPVGLLGKTPAEIDDFPLAGDIEQHAGDGRTAIFKQPEPADIDAFLKHRVTHLMSSHVVASAAPERCGPTQPRDRDGGIRRHAAARGCMVETPDFLATPVEKALDTPDL